jgi:glycosyltransferase involved in cell wall biosynthesis
LSDLIPDELKSHFQIIPSRVRELQQDKIRIYWVHDLPEDPEISHLKDKSGRDRFHKIIFNSNWQLNDAIAKLGIPRDEKIEIIETGINPIEWHPKPKDGDIRCVYFSTPHRGLELLVPVFDAISKKHDNVHLDVFSSYNIYGWDSADQRYEKLFDSIKEHPKMTYHGSVDQATMRSYLTKAHILAYPSIWPETSCRVLIESMSAGLLCVHPNLAALSDTSGMLTHMYQYRDDPRDHMAQFANALDSALENVRENTVQEYLRHVKAYTDARFNLGTISERWKAMMSGLLTQYPTAESRKIETEMFVYRTA